MGCYASKQSKANGAVYILEESTYICTGFFFASEHKMDAVKLAALSISGKFGLLSTTHCGQSARLAASVHRTQKPLHKPPGKVGSIDALCAFGGNADANW